MEDEKIRTFFRKVSSKFHESVLQQNKPLNTLNDIHNWFVVTQIDKTNNQVIFCGTTFLRNKLTW